MKKRTVIVGGGLSGLACATRLEKEDHDYIIIEKSSRLGGRVGSIYENGYIFDIGFQVYNTAYSTTNSLLDLDELDLKIFKPGSVIHDGKRFQMVSDPLRDMSQLFTSLFSSVATISDKFRVLSLKFDLSNYSINNDNSEDTSTFKYLRSRGFSDKFIELFFIPFFSGIFLENKLETSSKFFKYVFSKFSKGLAALPSKGMQKIPDIICRRVSNDSIMMNSNVKGISNNNVVELENSKVINADNIVLTGNSNKLIGCTPINYNAVTNLYFSSENFPENGNYIHLFPKDDIINNIAFLSSISSNYSSSSNCLISVSIFGIHIDNESLRKNIQQKLANYFGGKDYNYEFLRSYVIQQATIDQPTNYFFHSKSSIKDNIIIAGDHTVNGSIEGAIISGIKAADHITKNNNYNY